MRYEVDDPSIPHEVHEYLHESAVALVGVGVNCDG